MSTAVSQHSLAAQLLQEPAVSATAYAPVEAEALLAAIDRGDRAQPAIPDILARASDLRAMLLAARSGATEDLWLELREASSDLLGTLVDEMRAMPPRQLEAVVDRMRSTWERPDRSSAETDSLFADRELRVAIAGDFKRGKSTLINALIGRRVLPTRVAPATAVPCVIRSGQSGAFVYFSGASAPIEAPIDELARYACIPLPGTDMDELAFRAGVERVEIRLPDVLPPGVALIDLPGLNEERGRADMAREALALADVVLVVLAANQLLAEDELQLIDMLWRRGYRNMLFVVNYIDGLEPHEVATVKERSAALLAPYGGSHGETIFLISARQALLARVAGATLPPDEGFGALEARLKTGILPDAAAIWRTSRLRQALEIVDSGETEAGAAYFAICRSVDRLRREQEALAARLDRTGRIYEEADLAAAFDIAARRQRIVDHDASFAARWNLLETSLRERFKREPLPWVWQKAREWLRDELILAIREVHPQVSPRPEGYLRISLPPGLRVGRDALLTFYQGEASREWARFTSEPHQARRRELEEALATAERENHRLQENRDASRLPLEAHRIEIINLLEAAGSDADASLIIAQRTNRVLREILEALAP